MRLSTSINASHGHVLVPVALAIGKRVRHALSKVVAVVRSGKTSEPPNKYRSRLRVRPDDVSGGRGRIGRIQLETRLLRLAIITR